MSKDLDLAFDDDLDEIDSSSQEPPSLRAIKRRRKYLFAAMRCIRRVGPHEATMDLIAAEAGVTRATIYREFGSRQGVLSAVTAYRFEAFCVRFFRNLDDDLPLPDKLEAYFLAAGLLALHNPVTRTLVRGPLEFTQPGTPLHSVALRSWAPSLEKAALQPNLQTVDHEDLVQWILVSQFTLCRLMLDTKMPISRFKRYIRNFVLPAFS